ncbi:MAG: rod shape-determining protein MreC [Myxococcales bacterium]|nr:rod shape-determining protein MreC [Myxococcales bacterium]
MNFKRYRDAIIVVLALVIPFWFLRYNVKDDARGLSGPDRVILKLIAPIQYAASTLARGLSSIVSDYVYLVDVKKNNADLGAENAQLRARVNKLEALDAENRRLRSLLQLKNHLAGDAVSAQVLSKDTVEFFRVAHVTVDRSSPDLVSLAHFPVITLDGVVGVTGKVAGDTVEVQLVVDAGSGIDVVVERTGARGFVRGTGDEKKYLCKVEHVRRTDEVEVGDLLVTSGHGRRFPRGLPVARVTDVERRDFGLYQQVSATPTVDLSRLEEVLILVNSPAAIEGLSTTSPVAPDAPTPN